MVKAVALFFGALLLIGIVMIALPLGDSYEPECAEEGEVSSGFVEGDCAVSVDSFEEWREYQESSRFDRQPVRVLGILLSGLVVLTAPFALLGAFVIQRIRKPKQQEPAPAAPGNF